MIFMGTLREVSRWTSRQLFLLTCFTYLLHGHVVSAKSQLNPVTAAKHEDKPTEAVGWTQPPQGFTEPDGPQQSPEEPQRTDGEGVFSTAKLHETTVSVSGSDEPTVPSQTTLAPGSTTEFKTEEPTTETSMIETTTEISTTKLTSLGSMQETSQLPTSQPQSTLETTSSSSDHSTSLLETSTTTTAGLTTFGSTQEQENTSPMQTTPQTTHRLPPPPQPTTPHWTQRPSTNGFQTEGPNPPVETKSYTKPHKPTRPHPTVPSHPTEPSHRTKPPRPTEPPHPTEPLHSTEHSQQTVSPAITTQHTQDKTPMPRPKIFVQLFLQTLWQDLCPTIQDFLTSLSSYSKKVLQLSVLPTIKALNDTTKCPLNMLVRRDIPVDKTRVQLDLCVLAVTEMCDPLLTQRLGQKMQLDTEELQTYLVPKVLAVHIYGTAEATTDPQSPKSSATAIGVAMSVAFLLAACVAAIVVHKIYRNRVDRRRAVHIHYYCDGKSHDTLNESHQLSPLHKTTYSTSTAAGHQLVPAVNNGLVMDDEDTDAQNYPSHVLSMHGLSQFYSYLEAIVEEFETLPNFQSSPTRHRTSSKTTTATAHNLFLPPSKTRVSLEKASFDNQHGFLNASFVKGYGKSRYSYIATTSPWGTNLADFWEMVWEQQSRTIICLCSPEEMGVVCPWYWPRDEGIQAAQLYGDILVMRQGCVLTENYSMSTLLIKNIQNSLCRPINHFWFTQWSPATATVPSNPTVLLSFLLQVRQTVQETYGPIVVHCGDGCSRTGTLLTIDSGMRSMEDLCTVDVPSIVCCIRRDRGAAVLDRNHYAFIYKVLYEYSVMLTRGLANGKSAEDDEIDTKASFC